MNGCKHRIAKHFFNHCKSVRSCDSIGLSYTLDGVRFESWYKRDFFLLQNVKDWPWGQTSLLFKRYQEFFPRGQVAMAGCLPLTFT